MAENNNIVVFWDDWPENDVIVIPLRSINHYTFKKDFSELTIYTKEGIFKLQNNYKKEQIKKIHEYLQENL